MPDRAAFLRGMNLGKRRLTNLELAVPFEAIGLREVGVFRASGNVVFTAPPEPAADLCARIEAALAETLGYAVPTFLRTAAEVRAIARHQPFPSAAVEASRGKLQVMLLREAPHVEAVEEALALAPAGEQLAFAESELYWLPSGGLLESPLDLKAVARLLGPATQRTKGTLEQLASKYFAD